VGVNVIVGVLDNVGVKVVVDVLVGVLVQVEVRLVVEVNVPVKVGVRVRVAEAEGVNVAVFSTGWKGVTVAGPEKGVTVIGTEIPVMVGMNGRKGANSAGSTHPASSKQPAAKVNDNRPFIAKPKQSYLNARKGLYTVLIG